MLEALDAGAVRRWIRTAADDVAACRAEIDRLNVFPVRDADTGTNMAWTLQAAADAAEGTADGGAGAVLHIVARAAVLSARGNSGVILAQFLRGLADSLAGIDSCDAPALRTALRAGADHAYLAVTDPVEGTMLTVIRAAAVGAAAADTLAEVVLAAVRGATAALAHTTVQLPALTRAGVVDAGGQGIVLVLSAVQAVVGGGPARPMAAGASSAPPAGHREHGYEVQYLLDATAEHMTALRRRLSLLGDSLTVGDTGDGTWNVHVHVEDIGAAIEAGVEAGRPHAITVTRLVEPAPTGSGVHLVAVSPGPGLAHLFEAEGVRVVEPDGLTATIRELAGRMVLLPGPSAGAAADGAARAGRADGRDIAVIPTRSALQALAAVAVHDPERVVGDDVVAMAEAAAATRWAEVLVADREALTSAGRCVAGDVLGLIDDDVVEIGADAGPVALAVLDRLLGVGGDLVTILLGRVADPALGPALRRHVEGHAPGTEVAVLDGGQHGQLLLIGLE